MHKEILLLKSIAIRLLEISRKRRKYIIKMVLREVPHKNARWMDLA
jgi:hypothetical protein